MTANGTPDGDGRVAEIVKREAATDDGPWRYTDKAAITGHECNAVYSDNAMCTIAECGWFDQTKANAEFIAHAKQDIPYLLSALSTAQAERDGYRKECERLRKLIAVNAISTLSDPPHDPPIAVCNGCGAEATYLENTAHGEACWVDAALSTAKQGGGT